MAKEGFTLYDIGKSMYRTEDDTSDYESGDN